MPRACIYCPFVVLPCGVVPPARPGCTSSAAVAAGTGALRLDRKHRHHARHRIHAPPGPTPGDAAPPGTGAAPAAAALPGSAPAPDAGAPAATIGTPTPGLGAAPETASAATEVGELLQTFVKALRAHQLYLPNNPVYQRALETLRAAFVPVWEGQDELVIDVYDAELKHDNQVVYAQPNRSESIAWVLYKDGVRSMTLLPGVEKEEIIGLLDVLHRARTLQAEDNDDLLTLLWEKDFQLIRYAFQDLASDAGGPLIPTTAEVQPPPNAPYVRAAVEEEAPPRDTAGLVKAEDFDTTLYFLDDREIAYLKGEVEREYAQDLRRNVLAMIFDVLELQPFPTVRAELISIIDSFLPYLLGAGDFSSVAYVLREVKVVLERARELLPEHRQALQDLPGRLSREETLSQLLQSLDEAQTHPAAEELAELFGELRGEALPTMFAWLPRLSNARVREVLEIAVRRLAAGNAERVVSAIGSNDAAVVAEAVRLTGRLKLLQAVPALVGVAAQHKERAIRLAAVQALAEVGSPGAMQGLERTLEDDDREVRLAAVRVLGQRRHRASIGRIAALVQGKGVRVADLTEKMAFFEAYGAMVGEDGVAVLDAMLNSGGFLKKKEDPEVRACAAMALGRIGTPAARAALEKAVEAKEALVRNAVARALRGQTGSGA